MASRFRVALTRDFYDDEGRLRFGDIALDLLRGDGAIELTALAEHRPVIGADQVAGHQGIIVLTPAVTAAALVRANDLLALGRFGVGYDAVDVPACTAADVALFITVGAVDRSVAEATVAWMLALTHHVRAKDRIVRESRWNHRSQYMGTELRDRTLGVIGLGGIGRALVKLLAGFGMKRPLAFDPFLKPQGAAEAGVDPVSLEDLLRDADFVSIHCPLNDQTRNLIGARQFSLMKPTAFLINTARGGIVDEDALYEALAVRRIAGAAIDCFVGEPILKPHRLSELDNVLLAPHAIAWTEEMFRDIGRSVCGGMLDLAHSRRPSGVVNPDVFDKPSFQAKWQRLRVG
jgi:phosphoglycerate dehydrogenase-like enzyme